MIENTSKIEQKPHDEHVHGYFKNEAKNQQRREMQDLLSKKALGMNPKLQI